MKLPNPLYFLFLFLIASCGNKSSSSHDHEHEEKDHHDGVAINHHEAEEFGIVTETIAPSPFSETLKVGGRIEPAPGDIATLTARRSGILTLAPDISPGKEISKGTVVATISAAGLEGGDINASARATLEATKKELDRLTPLYQDGLITASQYNAAEQAYREAAALSSSSPKGGSGSETAPFSGTLSDLFVSSGDYVEAGTPIGILSKNVTLTLRADVPERYASLLPTVQSANFRPDYTQEIFSLDSLGGHKISGDSPSGGMKGYLPVRFSFFGNGKVIPGTFTEVYLICRPRNDALLLPSEALLEIQGNKYVYVETEPGIYEKRAVTTGGTDGIFIEITDGLEAGESVVTHGATAVRMAEMSRIAPPQHTHNH